MGQSSDQQSRTALCACGALSAEVQGDPVDVYACSCLNCQRETGSAFFYGAVFPEDAVTLKGERIAEEFQALVESDAFSTMQARGILGVEMEIAGLYAIAAREEARAMALLTVSDDIVRGGVMSSEDRENTFHDMVRIALALA